MQLPWTITHEGEDRPTHADHLGIDRKSRRCPSPRPRRDPRPGRRRAGQQEEVCGPVMLASRGCRHRGLTLSPRLPLRRRGALRPPTHLAAPDSRDAHRAAGQKVRPDPAGEGQTMVAVGGLARPISAACSTGRRQSSPSSYAGRAGLADRRLGENKRTAQWAVPTGRPSSLREEEMRTEKDRTRSPRGQAGARRSLSRGQWRMASPCCAGMGEVLVSRRRPARDAKSINGLSLARRNPPWDSMIPGGSRTFRRAWRGRLARAARRAGASND